MRATLAFLLLAAPALASGEDEWQQFRQMVMDRCLAQIEQGGEISVEVNPFGSASYGVAIVTVTSGGEGTDRMACIVDKATGAAELTAPF